MRSHQANHAGITLLEHRDFAAADSKPNQNRSTDVKRRATKTSLIGIFLLLTLLAGFVSAAEANQNLPDLGGGSGVITPAQERALGMAWLRSLRRQVDAFPDPMILEYVQDLVYKLAPNSQLQDRRLTTIVIDSSALNAFAAPGGIIGINAGLFLYAETEQEFASVVAHEIAHLSQRHFARRLEENQNHTLLNMAGLLASVIIAATAGSDAGVAALAGSQALSLQQQLNYSRLQEQEADRIGMDTMAASGMDARAMSAMFERMLRTSRFNRKVPEYLRTHPLTESRVSDTANRAGNFPKGTYREQVEFYFSKSRVMLAYAESPEDAMELFESQMASSNPYVNSMVRYGYVLAAIKANQAGKAEQQLQNLINREPNRISVVMLQAEWLNAMQRRAEAIQLLQENLDRNSGNYGISRLLADYLNAAGGHDNALKLLYQLTPEYGHNPDIWFDVAETAGLAGEISSLHQARAEYFFLLGDSQKALRHLQQALDKIGSNYQKEQIIRTRIKQMSEQEKSFRF